MQRSVQTFSGQFILVKYEVYCIDVAMRGLVHDVETTNTLPMLTANSIWKSFLKYE